MKGKRLLAASLSIAMVFSLNTVAFADESNLPSEVQENTSILEDSDVSDEEETNEVIAEDNLKEKDEAVKDDVNSEEQKTDSVVKKGENGNQNVQSKEAKTAKQSQTKITIANDSGTVEYDTIADAFAALKAGDVLTIPAGTWAATANDQLRIDVANVTVQGVGADTVIDCGAYTCSGQAGILVGADNITVKDLTVKSSGNPSSMGTIKVTGMGADNIVNGGTLENIAIVNSGNGYGLNIHGVDGFTVNNVDVQKSKKSAVAIANSMNLKVEGLKTCASDGFGYWQDVTFNYKANDPAYLKL